MTEEEKQRIEHFKQLNANDAASAIDPNQKIVPQAVRVSDIALGVYFGSLMTAGTWLALWAIWQLIVSMKP